MCIYISLVLLVHIHMQTSISKLQWQSCFMELREETEHVCVAVCVAVYVAVRIAMCVRQCVIKCVP